MLTSKYHVHMREDILYMYSITEKLRNTCIVLTRRPLQHAVSMRAPNYFVCCVGTGCILPCLQDLISVFPAVGMEVLLRPPRATYEIADRYHRGNTVYYVVVLPFQGRIITSRAGQEASVARSLPGIKTATLPPCACVLGLSTFSALLIRSDRRLRSL